MASISFMRAPDPGLTFDVGDSVEVYCDHEKDGQRIRGWQKGIVVQVMQKWLPFNSEQMYFLRMAGWFQIIYYGTQ